MTRVRSVLPGSRRLLLAGWSSAAVDADEVLASVTLTDGAVRERRISA